VADLAAASSVVYPGLEWAVAVARGASGVAELWVITNEGSRYIPAGVYVPRAIHLYHRANCPAPSRNYLKPHH
jgi:hypothetical protein